MEIEADEIDVVDRLCSSSSASSSSGAEKEKTGTLIWTSEGGERGRLTGLAAVAGSSSTVMEKVGTTVAYTGEALLGAG